MEVCVFMYIMYVCILILCVSSTVDIVDYAILILYIFILEYLVLVYICTMYTILD